MYTIDTKKDEKFFIVINNQTNISVRVSKACNTLEQVKQQIGLLNIKEVI